MSKHWSKVLAVCAAFVLGVIVAPRLIPNARAQTSPGLAIGAGHTAVVIEEFAFRTAKGVRSSVRVQRNHLVVEPSYGRLIAIHEVKGRSVLWYQAADGTLRNVILNGLDAVKITAP